MENSVSNEISLLMKKLDEADNKAKLLNMEVLGIKRKIVELKNSLIFKNFESRVAEASTSDVIPNKKRKMNGNSSTDYLEVYTDGACENNGRPNAKAGIGVWFGQDDSRNISKPVIGKATNNTAEIQACIAALEVCQSEGIEKVLLKTDSEFTINCMTKWIEGWKRKNWRKADGKPVINKDDLQKLDLLCSQMDVKWEHIRGHSGEIGNEEADRLARYGASAYKK